MVKKIKGGYKTKDGFYIKSDCKNSLEDGHMDEEGYILDPITYDRITSGNIVQFSDDLCYNKSEPFYNNLRTAKKLPFGNPLTDSDMATLNIGIRPQNNLEVLPPPPIQQRGFPRIAPLPQRPLPPGQARAPLPRFRDIYNEETGEMDRYEIDYGRAPVYGIRGGNTKKRKGSKKRKSSKKRKGSKKRKSSKKNKTKRK